MHEGVSVSGRLGQTRVVLGQRKQGSLHMAAAVGTANRGHLTAPDGGVHALMMMVHVIKERGYNLVN